MSFGIPTPSLSLANHEWSNEDYIPSYVDIYTVPDDIDTFTPFKKEQLPTEFKFYKPSTPYIPENLHRLLEKGKISQLKNEEMTKLIEGIAKISINFYELKPDKYVAIGFDGRIMESADSQIKLLMKIQGREFKQDIFVWHVGSEYFSGWGF